MKHTALPFSLNPNDGRPLVEQLQDGLRQAIVEGRFKTGDSIPSYRDLAPILGVSQIVTKTAMHRLAEEGYVVSRPRVGTVVRDRAAKQWRGHVVLVYETGDDNYLESKLAGAMRERLLDAGYLMTQSCVRRVGGGKLDFNALDASLSRSVDLAIVMYHRPEINAHLMKAGVPFAVFGEKAVPPRGAVGAIHLDYDRAVPAFAEACKAAGIEEVVEICWHRLMCDVAPGLESAGIRVTKKMVVVDESEGRLIGVKRAGRLAFQAIIQNAECRMHNAQCHAATASNFAHQRPTSRGSAQLRAARRSRAEPTSSPTTISRKGRLRRWATRDCTRRRTCGLPLLQTEDSAPTTPCRSRAWSSTPSAPARLSRTPLPPILRLANSALVSP